MLNLPNKFVQLSSVMFLSGLLCAQVQAKAQAQDDQILLTTIENSHLQTISSQILQQAYNNLDIELSIKPLPAARALSYTNSGRADGEVSRVADIEEQFPNLVAVPVAINYLKATALSISPDIDISNWQSLSQYKIAILRGNKFAEKGTQGLNTEIVNSQEQLLKMLTSGRIDIAITTLLNSHEIRRLNNLSPVPLPIYRLRCNLPWIPLYHYLHSKNSHLLPRLTEELSRMEQQGELKQIRSAYIKEHLPLLDRDRPLNPPHSS